MKKPTGDILVYLNDIRETAKLLIEDVESVEAQLDEVKSPAMFEERIDHLALSQKNLVTRPHSKSHASASAAWNEPLVTTPPPLCSGRTDCIAWAIQPPALSVLPT